MKCFINNLRYALIRDKTQTNCLITQTVGLVVYWIWHSVQIKNHFPNSNRKAKVFWSKKDNSGSIA